MNDLLAQMFGGAAFGNAAASNPFSTLQQQASLQAQAIANGWRPTVVETPEEQKQQTIKWKNKANYDSWLARMQRDPLNDCEAR